MGDAFAAALRKGSAEVLILSMIEARARHGYEIARLIEERSDGVVRFHVASFYPLLYQLERRGLIKGRWVEREGQRRRRYYRITPAGRTVLARQRSRWQDFIIAVSRLARLRPT
ncbi:MAG TPA: PadR family transcriptional regulator [Vicinamibacterales bacterium]|jgi:transcriptional regulator|nr:PadR family transcriptional regulator [Vicinamibacterales bacterium]